MNSKNNSRKINIGIDCWALRKNGGGARYVFESIFRYFDFNRFKFVLFLHEEADECIKNLQEKNGITRNVLRLKISNPSQIARHLHLIDVIYCPFNNISFRPFCIPVIAVLHDVQEMYFPKFFSKEDYAARLEVYSDLLRASNAVITISNFCKDSFIEKYHANSEKIKVVYNAAQEALVELSQPTSYELKNMSIKSDFILYTANFYAHKNHQKLIDAYILAKNKNVEIPKLLLVGESWHGDRVRLRVEKEKLSKEIIFMSGLQASELAWLYKNCKFVVIPTFFEGFCLPAVEALAFGKLVVCSDIPILREVTSNLGEYFDPNDPVQISEKILYSLSMEKKISPAIVVNRINASKKYNWKNSSSLTLDIIQETCNDYYSEDKIIEVEGSEYNLIILIDDENFQWLDVTLRSICVEMIKPNRLNIHILNKSNALTVDDINGIASKSFYNEIKIFNDLDTLVHAAERDGYLSIVECGSVIFKNFFINIINEFNSNKMKKILIGEVQQCHEDDEMSYESDCYVRIISKSAIFPKFLHIEMINFKSLKDFKELYDQFSTINIYEFISQFVEGDRLAFISRILLAKVRFRNSLKYQAAYEVIPRVSTFENIYGMVTFPEYKEKIQKANVLASLALAKV